jgi:hypothetical protein
MSVAGGIIASYLGFAALPRQLCSAGVDAAWSGDAAETGALGRNVARHVDELQRARFSTGSRRFDGEWTFGTAMMAAMAFGQSARAHPSHAALSLERMDRALDAALVSDARAFDREAWRSDPIDTLSTSEGHAAYLGYLNLALSVRRFLGPSSRFAALNDRVSEALARRLEASATGVLETYPGERYPVDNAAVVASLALRARALGEAPPAVVTRWIQALPGRFVDRQTGLLVQAVAADGAAVDAPRGSGTALAAYFLSFADQGASAALHGAVARELRGDVVGFGVVREYPRGRAAGHGDIDSGPLVLGWSISAMGFHWAGCRIHGDRESFEQLHRSFVLFGAPTSVGNERTYASGGPLGNAIVLAIRTALPASAWRAQ